MAKPRVTATDQLANVIEVVELGRRTGMLSVERGSGSVLEEGEIYFVSGRASYASLAGLRGREALTALGRWGPCRFTFDVNGERPAPNIPAGPPPSQAPITGGRTGQSQMNPSFSPAPPTGPTTFGGQQPGYQPGYETGYGQRQPSEGSGTWDLPQRGPASPQRATGSFGQDAFGGYSGGNGTTGRIYPLGGAGMGDGNELWRQVEPRPYPPVQNGAAPTSAPGGTTFLARRPRRAPDVRDLMAVVTAHNLSRSHRTILLLADGEHTILDLARLSSKSVDEVMVLLGDLETRGLVYYYS